MWSPIKVFFSVYVKTFDELSLSFEICLKSTDEEILPEAPGTSEEILLSRAKNPSHS